VSIHGNNLPITKECLIGELRRFGGLLLDAKYNGRATDLTPLQVDFIISDTQKMINELEGKTQRVIGFKK
jgi:hypothetical protein